jgi:excisionase family DNA binding protein
MSGLIASRQNSPTRRAAELYKLADFQPQPKIEAPNSWDVLPLYLTPRIICTIIKVSAPTVLKWIENGELKASKKAGKWFIDKDDFKSFMNKSEVIIT